MILNAIVCSTWQPSAVHQDSGCAAVRQDAQPSAMPLVLWKWWRFEGARLHSSSGVLWASPLLLMAAAALGVSLDPEELSDRESTPVLRATS